MINLFINHIIIIFIKVKELYLFIYVIKLYYKLLKLLFIFEFTSSFYLSY